MNNRGHEPIAEETKVLMPESRPRFGIGPRAEATNQYRNFYKTEGKDFPSLGPIVEQPS